MILRQVTRSYVLHSRLTLKLALRRRGGDVATLMLKCYFPIFDKPILNRTPRRSDLRFLLCERYKI